MRLAFILFIILPSLSWAQETKTASNKIGPALVGKQAPDFQLQDRNGRIYSMADFKGNLVLLNFWATWCPPCIEELPSMEVLNRRMKARNFVMVAVSVDESWADIDKLFSTFSNQPSFLVLLDKEKKVVTGKYGTTVFPESFLIDPKGRVLKHYIGPYPWTDGTIFNGIYDFLLKSQ